MTHGTRWMVALALAGVGLGGAAAQAAIKIEQATVQNGVAFVKGNGAALGAQITWEGVAVTTANKKNGGFSFFGVPPDDCSGQLSDGASSVNVAVLGCTPVTKAGAPAPVPQTGQTLCYDGVGIRIPCLGTGQDGELQAGVESPSPRFTDNGDGTVTDYLTGLIWLQNANCFGEKTWADALTAANGLADGQCELSDGSVAGDWRLPNLRELHSLVDYGRSPALPADHLFTNFQVSGVSYYWLSTSYASNPHSA